MYFVLLDEGSGDPIVAGTPSATLISEGTTAVSTNIVSYEGDNLWSLQLTSTETTLISVIPPIRHVFSQKAVRDSTPSQ